jgi:hypothetical protein
MGLSEITKEKKREEERKEKSEGSKEERQKNIFQTPTKSTAPERLRSLVEFLRREI